MTSDGAAQGGPRALLRRLHDVMAQSAGAQERLDAVVLEIAHNMAVDVCSIYVANAAGALELFATRGLSPAAVRKTTLRPGEGLVGTIAQTRQVLNLKDAAAHPKFAYKPETGEEAYLSFAGVPIFFARRVVGVLGIQTAVSRAFNAEDIEVLQTIAMVLAEILSNLREAAPLPMDAGADVAATSVMSGQSLVDGVAIGKVIFHEPSVDITRTLAEDLEAEKLRVRAAFTQMRAQIDTMMNAADVGHAGEHREILLTYKMFAFDRGWAERIERAIDQGLTAEAAVESVRQGYRASMRKTSDPYLLERLHDLDDLSNRLNRFVTGAPGSAAAGTLSGDVVVFARSLGPAELLEYDRAHLKAVVLEEGSTTAHVTIVAKAMGIPLLGRVRGVLDVVTAGDDVVVDAEHAQLHIHPSTATMESFANAVAQRDARTLEYREARDLPSQTLDGVPITLLMNAGLKADLPSLDDTGAAGIGLFRTEFQFMVSATLPRVTAQAQFYTEVFDAAGDRPITFRALDIGGDKHVPYIDRGEEENPALGWRAVRITLERPALLQMQVRALIRAAQGRPLSIMFPMVADVDEVLRSKAIVEKEIQFARRLGHVLPSNLRIGVMLEVPALAWQLDALLPLIDFMAIGTNDLLQFFFAADRGNPKLSERYDLLSPAALNLIHTVITACKRHDVEVSLCGEVGGRPLEAMVLIGLGLRRFSMSPASIGPVKQMIRSLKIQDVDKFSASLLNQHDHSVREMAQLFAVERKISV